MKYSNFAKYDAYFKRAYYYIRIHLFAINSILRIPKDCFRKNHLMQFAGSDLGLIRSSRSVVFLRKGVDAKVWFQ